MNKQCGFTLVELMITLAIAVILLTIGVPSFNTMIKSNRLTTATNDLHAVLNLARSEAVTRGHRVTVCKSADQATCASGSGWEQGWIVFTDQNNNAAYDPGATPPEILLRVHTALGSQISATGNTNIADYISYTAAGQSQLKTGAAQLGTVKFCDDRAGVFGKNLVISWTGRVQTVADGVTCP
jgi:type IV fimbrial biogenesis protein FimT